MDAELYLFGRFAIPSRKHKFQTLGRLGWKLGRAPNVTFLDMSIAIVENLGLRGLGGLGVCRTVHFSNISLALLEDVQ